MLSQLISICSITASSINNIKEEKGLEIKRKGSEDSYQRNMIKWVKITWMEIILTQTTEVKNFAVNLNSIRKMIWQMQLERGSLPVPVI